MTRIYAKHEPYGDGHLGEVAAVMEVAGAPTIRAVEHRGALFAIEGSHRLYAAYATGLIPKVIVLEPDLDAGCASFFDRATADLPAYDFDHLLVLMEKDFRP